MEVLANVIFPAFTAPYYSYFFFPLAGIAAVAAEVVILKKRHPALTLTRVFIFTLVANIASWMLGIAISSQLPSGLTPKVIQNGDHEFSTISQGPHFNQLVLAGFGVAFILSILIEYPVWKYLTRRKMLPRLFISICYAHVASYIALIGFAVISSYFLI